MLFDDNWKYEPCITHMATNFESANVVVHIQPGEKQTNETIDRFVMISSS